MGRSTQGSTLIEISCAEMSGPWPQIRMQQVRGAARPARDALKPYQKID